MHPLECAGLMAHTGSLDARSGQQPEFRVTVTLVLDDAVALWTAARDRLLADGMTPEQVEETIGTSDTPLLDDCIALLCDPVSLYGNGRTPGCRIDDFWIDSLRHLPRYEALPVAPAIRAVAG